MTVDWHTVAFVAGMAGLWVAAVVGTWWAERPIRKFWGSAGNRGQP